jgi:miniconductance mechanosensitive channel
MTAETYKYWLQQEPGLTIGLSFLLVLITFLITRNFFVKIIVYLVKHSRTKIDDILVKHLNPLRMAWLSPFAVIYFGASLLPDYHIGIQKAAIFFILWIISLTISGLLSAINEIYESRPNYKGVSIQSYLDIGRIIVFAVAAILSSSIISGQSPVVLLTGLGAITAVLLLVFQDTILSLVASVQINTMDLIKEGDWIEVPSYGADGDVLNISLHTIKVQNFDMTTTVIPTHKMREVAYKNWRGMRDAGGRRIQRPIRIDMTSMRICDDKMLKEFGKIDLIHDYLQKRVADISKYKIEHADHFDSPLDGPQITNTELFRVYIESYLHSRKDIHQSGLPFLVRSLEPTPTGLPIEVYVFTNTTRWEEYEAIQSEIFDHLLAAANHFELRIFQEPTGLDFSMLVKK